MDVGELLNFKPVSAPKRPLPVPPSGRDDLDEDDESYEKRAAAKRRRAAQKQRQKEEEQERMKMLEAEAGNLSANAAASGGGMKGDPSRTSIEEHVDSVEGGENDGAMTEARLKKLVLNFEKKATKNQELRIKFPDEPVKFLNSEVELHDTIQEMRVVATAPDFYPDLVALGSVQSLLGLLSHENTDIAVAVVDLLQEMTDADNLSESASSEEATEALVNAMMTNQVSALLIQNMERLNESVREESDGIHNTLSIVENLIEYRPEQVCKDIAQESGLLTWLVKKLKVKVPFDNNKLYASEILSILLQNEPDNRRALVELTGVSSPMDSMLQQLAFYKRHNPKTAEEQEMMENLFNCLCSLLLHVPNRDRFLKGEGLQLMNLMLREKKVSRNGALKVLNHALIGPEGKDNCHKFIDILGLRTIFPLFMKTPKKTKRTVSAEEHEEHVISIVASLMKNCRGPQRQRMLAKFTENDHEKVERLMEMHFKFLEKVTETEQDIAREGNEDDIDEDEMYLRRLSGGLFTLQLVDYVILDACSSAAPSVKQRVMAILGQRKNATIQTIRNVVREYAANVGGDEGSGADDAASTEQEKSYMLHLADKF